MSSQTQSLRFRRPTNVPEKPIPAPVARHTGILQDQLRRAQRRPWTPSFSLAIRLLFLVRVTGAMYSNIDDCDEVYNFWEPLHFLEQGYGFQTWELSPKFALRSWAYILLHYLPTRVGELLASGDKRAAFFAVRIFLATISVFVEAKIYRTVVDKVNDRVGRYYFFMMFFSAGMWSASTSFLPSSFAMYTSTLAFSYAFTPSSSKNNRRTLATTLIFASGGIVGWPFALALALPFVFEELFLYGADLVAPETKTSWMIQRWARLFMAGLAALLVFIPVIGIDSLAYGKFVIVPWNIIRYNIFGGSERGPDLYGTAPWNFYINNLVLNFNCILPLALLSLPALGVTYMVDRKRLGLISPTSNQSSPFTLLGLRLAPLYLWFVILSLQPHKEERFMFPAYPLLCFNAAVALYLMRGWLEVAFIKVTNSPYRASQSLLFSNFTFSLVVTSALISVSRILALWHYYHAPLSLAYDLQHTEIPRLLNVTGLLPVYPENMTEEDKPPIDLSPVKEFDLKLCLGKEWYRFPGHYVIPSGIQVEFIKSEFDGMLPRHFEKEKTRRATDEGNDVLMGLANEWWLKPQTSYVPNDLNDLNQEDPSHYVPVEECDYLIDLDFPHHPIFSALEPRYATMHETWERVTCHPFLDARHSFLLTRIFWLPGERWRSGNEFGDYCLLKNWKRVEMKETQVKRYL